MLKITDSLDNIVYLTVDGKIEATSLEQAVEAVEEKVTRYGNVRLYMAVRHLEGYDSVAAFLTDAKKTLQLYTDFEKVAIGR